MTLLVLHYVFLTLAVLIFLVEAFDSGNNRNINMVALGLALLALGILL